MDSMWSAYFFITTPRLSLSVGVSSSVVTEKSQGRMVNFWILEAFEGHTCKGFKREERKGKAGRREEG